MKQFWLILILLLPLRMPAQTASIDSLTISLNQADNDSSRFSLLEQLAAKLRRANPAKAETYASEALIIAQENGWKRREGIAYIRLAVVASNLGNYQKAKEKAEKALQIHQEVKDSTYISFDLLILGNSCRHLGDYSKSLEHQIRALNIRKATNTNEADIARNYTSIGNVYSLSGDFEKSIEYYEKGLDIWKKYGSPEDEANSYANIGALYLTNLKPEKAQVYLKRSMEIFDSLQIPYGIGATATNLGNAYMLFGEYEKAREASLKGLEIYRQQGDQARVAMILTQLGEIQQEAGYYSKAINYYQQVLPLVDSIGLLDTKKLIFERLSEAYASQGQHQQALEARLVFETLKDSLLNAQTLQQLNELDAQYQSQQKDQEIAYYKIDLERRTRERNVLLFGSALLFILGALAILALVSRQRAYRKLQKEQQRTATLLEKLQATQAQLLQSEKMASLGQLTAGIAHEINNPINFITSNIEALKLDFQDINQLLELLSLLDDDHQQKVIAQLVKYTKEIDINFLREEISQLLASIERGAHRTDEIVKSLRNFSRNTTEHFLKANIHEALDATILLVKNNLPEKVFIHKEYGQIPEIYCQVSRLNQVFLNILTNAIYATKPSGTISISTQLLGSQVEITIADTGKGMDAATQSHIFEPFFTTKEVGQGTGLGLSISYSIIKQHNGNITVKSQLNEGTAFHILLPIEQNTSPEHL